MEFSFYLKTSFVSLLLLLSYYILRWYYVRSKTRQTTNNNKSQIDPLHHFFLPKFICLSWSDKKWLWLHCKSPTVLRKMPTSAFDWYESDDGESPSKKSSAYVGISQCLQAIQNDDGQNLEKLITKFGVDCNITFKKRGEVIFWCNHIQKFIQWLKRGDFLRVLSPYITYSVFFITNTWNSQPVSDFRFSFAYKKDWVFDGWTNNTFPNSMEK